jgi:hypothetical protein
MKTPRHLRNIALGFALGSMGVYAFAVTIPNTFTGGQTISAALFNANFAAIKTAVDALEANGSVTGARLADGAVTASKLSAAGGADGKVLKLQGGNLAWGDDQLGTAGGTAYTATDGVALNGTQFSLSSGGVSGAKLADGAITAAKIADGAISSAKTSNEPGIAASRSSRSNFIASTGSVTDVVSASITTPDAGQIIVDASFQAGLQGTAGAKCFINAQIDETAGGSIDLENSYAVGFDALPNASLIYLPFVTRRVYQKAAGSYTFRLEALKASDAGCSSADAWNPRITLMYIPTSYGTVVTN